MNVALSYFQLVSKHFVPVATLSVQKTFNEIEELSLRLPHPVAIYMSRHNYAEA